MEPEEIGQTLLIRYLLGDLSEDEQVQVEDRALADKDYLGELEAAEVDLIDSYVCGELPRQWRRAFEDRFLTSPQRRRKVEFARDLAKAAAEFKATENRVPVSRSLMDLFRGWTPGLRFATGLAAVIFVAGVSWLGVQNAAMRSRVAALEANRGELESRERELRTQLSDQERRLNNVAPPARQQSDSGQQVPAVASLVLMPGLSRGERRVTHLLLHASSQIANIEVQLEPRDNYPRFRAELRTRRGEDVLTAGNLRRHRTATGYMVSLDVPVSTLASGEYELALKGIAKDHSDQDVGYYYFSVQKK